MLPEPSVTVKLFEVVLREARSARQTSRLRQVCTSTVVIEADRISHNRSALAGVVADHHVCRASDRWDFGVVDGHREGTSCGIARAVGDGEAIRSRARWEARSARQTSRLRQVCTCTVVIEADRISHYRCALAGIVADDHVCRAGNCWCLRVVDGHREGTSCGVARAVGDGEAIRSGSRREARSARQTSRLRQVCSSTVVIEADRISHNRSALAGVVADDHVGWASDCGNFGVVDGHREGTSCSVARAVGDGEAIRSCSRREARSARQTSRLRQVRTRTVVIEADRISHNRRALAGVVADDHVGGASDRWDFGVVDGYREGTSCSVAGAVGDGEAIRSRARREARSARQTSRLRQVGSSTVVIEADRISHDRRALAGIVADHHVGGASDRWDFGVVDGHREGTSCSVARTVGDGEAIRSRANREARSARQTSRLRQVRTCTVVIEADRISHYRCALAGIVADDHVGRASDRWDFRVVDGHGEGTSCGVAGTVSDGEAIRSCARREARSARQTSRLRQVRSRTIVIEADRIGHDRRALAGVVADDHVGGASDCGDFRVVDCHGEGASCSVARTVGDGKAIRSCSRREARSARQTSRLRQVRTSTVVIEADRISHNRRALTRIVADDHVCRAVDCRYLRVVDGHGEGTSCGVARAVGDGEAIRSRSRREARSARQTSRLRQVCTRTIVIEADRIRHDRRALAGIVADHDVGGASDGWDFRVVDGHREGTSCGIARTIRDGEAIRSCSRGSSIRLPNQPFAPSWLPHNCH